MNAQTILLSAFTAVCLSSAGCGSSEAVTATSEQNAYARIEGLGDVAADEAAFAEAFVDGAVPESREDYAQHGYQIAGEARIDEDTATVPVKIFGGVYNSSEGDRSSRKASAPTESTQTWTLKRTGDEWKIQDAPLD